MASGHFATNARICEEMKRISTLRGFIIFSHHQETKLLLRSLEWLINISFIIEEMVTLVASFLDLKQETHVHSFCSWQLYKTSKKKQRELKDVLNM